MGDRSTWWSDGGRSDPARHPGWPPKVRPRTGEQLRVVTSGGNAVAQPGERWRSASGNTPDRPSTAAMTWGRYSATMWNAMPAGGLVAQHQGTRPPNSATVRSVFSDGYLLLIATEESLADLNTCVPDPCR